MSIHFVGLDVDSATAHYRAKTGQWVSPMRGIFLAADADADVVILSHAVRIAAYLYPNAYLSAASAVLLGLADGGRLFISARRAQRTRLRSLEIIQNQGPLHPSLVVASVRDPLGELVVKASSPRQRLLEAFRIRSEHAASISDAMRRDITDRLIAEYGDVAAVIDAVQAFASENGWQREVAAVEGWLRAGTRPIRDATANAIRFHVAWHGVPIGKLEHDGFEWRWLPAQIDLPSPVRTVGAGTLPPFIASLLPEGWLGQVVGARDNRDLLAGGHRYMSNIVIVDDPSKLAAMAPDILEGRLESWTTNGRFVGEYRGPGSSAVAGQLEQAIAHLYATQETPRLSGIQMKAPMFLDATGVLIDASRHPFTHILKPASGAGFDSLPLVEWAALEMAHAVGLEVPPHALVQMPDGLPPALVVERFDIRHGVSDRTWYCLEDFCSVLGVPTEAKYRSTIERVGKGLRSICTEPEQDIMTLFRRALFAWLIADGDMHLKNLAVLKTAGAGSATFAQVHMAPIYDAVTTRVFPRFAQDRMALKLNGKDDNLDRDDFLSLARTLGLRVAAAKQTVDQMCEKLAEAAADVAVPAIADLPARSLEMLDQQRTLVRQRCAAMSR